MSDRHDLQEVGELIRLQTALPNSGELVTHRVLKLDSNQYETESLRQQIENSGSEETREVLEKRLEDLDKNKDGVPIVILSGFSGGPTMNEAWALGASGRPVYSLSHLENDLTDTSRTNLENWDLEKYSDFFETVLDQLEIDECDVVSWSAGSLMMLNLASKEDSKVNIRKLVLHNPSGVVKRNELEVIFGLAREIPWILRRTGRKVEARQQITKPIIPPEIDDVESKGEAKNARGILKLISKGLPDEVLEKIKSKVLIASSEKDRVFPLDRLKNKVEKLGISDRVEYRKYRDRGHSGIIVDELVALPILSWLDKEG